jgi:tyrosyl-tRNA synthetase
MNTVDEDIERFLKLFSFMSEKEIDELVAKHMEAPENRG